MNNSTVNTQNNNVVEINFADVWFVVTRRLPLLLVALIFGGILGGVLAHFTYVPTYDSRSMIYILSASNDSVINLSDLSIGESLAPDYKTLLTCRPVMESVIENLGLDEQFTVTTLTKTIEISNEESSRMLMIDVTTENPQLSADIANELTEIAIEWIPAIMECDPPSVVEEAIPNTYDPGPSYVKYCTIGAAGLAAFVFIIFFASYMMDDTVRSSEDLERVFGMVALAMIPEDNEQPRLASEKSKGSSKKKVPHSKTGGNVKAASAAPKEEIKPGAGADEEKSAEPEPDKNLQKKESADASAAAGKGKGGKRS